MGLYAGAFDNRALAGTLVKLLTSPPLDLGFTQIIQLQMDRAEYCLVAGDTLQVLMINAAASGCLSHTLCHCGEQMAFPRLQTIRSVLNGLMAHSLNARAIWLLVMGRTYKAISKTRWWSWYETSISMQEGLPLFRQWLLHERLNDNKTVKKLRSMWTPELETVVDFEMTVLQAAAGPFVKATYRLESDQASNAFVAYDILTDLQAMQTVQMPNMDFPAIQIAAIKLAAAGLAPPQQTEVCRLLERSGSVGCCVTGVDRVK